MSLLPHPFRALALVAAAALSLGFAPVLGGTEPFAPQLVTVDTPSRAHKHLLTGLGLDLTEHAGHDYVEVVLHTAGEAEALRAAGFTWTVRIPDLVAREAEINAANAAYAAATDVSPLPSGRDSYRMLADYERELAELARAHPTLTRLLELGTSLEGKPIVGLEIAEDVTAADGRPVFAMFGLHHAREWPSGEHTIEFAYDLLNGYASGDPRITRLLRDGRAIIVPVVNPDGFEQSVNDGMLVDLREIDRGGIVSILATPGNAYKRKNCRVVDGLDATPPGACTAAASPGGYGIGVDLNRNYGTFWGGPGASPHYPHATYRGAGPFSEPETQAVRELIAARQVTTLITNHTFSNLVLRPNGVAPDTIGPDGFPVGNAPDEEAMRELGARMTAENGYRNIHGWELYDTTGTTEDWSYNSTGGYGYTFEIGAHEFHPPYGEVVAEYLGTAEDHPGGGNREAYLIAFENALDPDSHSIIAGKAPAGATLRLTRKSATPTWEGSFTDLVESTMVVDGNGRFAWHVNPSTRPVVMARQYRVTGEKPKAQASFTGTAPLPQEHVDVEYKLDAPVDVLEVTLDWELPDDLDLYLFRNEDGSLKEVGSSGNFIDEKERILLQDVPAGDYVIRVHNYAAAPGQAWTVTASQFDATQETVPGLIEAWTLSCEQDGEVLEQVPVVVDRGGQAKVNLRRCAAALAGG